ncbi:MAG: hypothetical protein JXQ73_11055 [Phycisphaerae bacterium]|nr:hypothetical protein [Phycisphaerae bacterium]
MSSSRPFIALLDADDLTCARAACPETLSGNVLALDTDIHLILQQQGIEHVTPWDIVGHDERPRMAAYESAVWEHWRRHGRLDYEGINLLGMAAFRHVGALARLGWVAYALRRALEELGPDEVVTFDEPASHGLDQPVDYAKMPLLFGVLRGLAEQAGLPIRLISREALPGAAGFEDQVAKRNQRVYAPVEAEAAIGGRSFVLFQANGDDLLRQLPLIREVRRRFDCHVVQLYKDASEEIVRRLQSEGHWVWHETQVAQWAPVSEIGAAARAGLEAFKAAGRESVDELRVLFDNEHVRCHFEFLFGPYAEKMAEHVRAWRGFFDRCRPAAFVTNYHAPIYDVAAGGGIPCLGLPHGLMMYGHVSWFGSLPDKSSIGAISDRHRETLILAGIEADRIVVTGDPYSDELLAEAHQRDEGGGAAADLRGQYDISPDRRIVLLCTTKVGMPSKLTHMPYVDWEDGVRCTRELADLVRRRGEWAFFIKPHPRWDLLGLYAEVNRGLPADRQIVVLPNQALGPVVEAADAVCCWCVISSALVEASLVGKPVMMFGRNLIWYDPRVWATDGWPHFNSLEDFEAELELLFSSPAHYAERIAQTAEAVRQFLGRTRESSVDRCMAWLGRHLAPLT